MVHKFCLNCSAKNYYEVNPPAFCQNCGEAFNRASNFSSSKKKPTRASSRRPDPEPEEPEEDEVEYDLRNCQIEYEVENAHYETVGDAIFQNGAPKQGQRGARPSPFKSGEDAIKKTMEECSSSREKPKEL